MHWAAVGGIMSETSGSGNDSVPLSKGVALDSVCAWACASMCASPGSVEATIPPTAIGTLLVRRRTTVGAQASLSERTLQTDGSIAWCFLLNMSLTGHTGYQNLVLGLIIQEDNHTNCCREIVSWFAGMLAALRFWRTQPSILMARGSPAGSAC